MRFTGVVSLVLLATFVTAAYQAGWWTIMNTWDPHTWAIVSWIAAMVWSIRDDFGGRSG